MKGNILICILGLLLVLLSSCGTVDSNGAVSQEIQPIASEGTSGSIGNGIGTGGMAHAEGGENGMAGDGAVKSEIAVLVSDASAEDKTSEADGASDIDTYRSIYMQLVRESEGDSTVFSLIYLDGDDIPELVVFDRGYDTYSVYAIKGSTVSCMVDSMATVELVYFERSGILAKFARWNGGGDEGGYGWSYYQVAGDGRPTDDAIPVLDYSYNAIYSEDGRYTGEGAVNYFYKGQEIDEAAYQRVLDSWGIAEGSGRPCGEDALGGEEMLGLLSR